MPQPPDRGANDTAHDPALPQKKRARRRLVGAAALCLAVAIALPLVFDSEPRQKHEDVKVVIPSRDTPLPSKPEGSAESGSTASGQVGSAAVDQGTASGTGTPSAPSTQGTGTAPAGASGPAAAAPGTSNPTDAAAAPATGSRTAEPGGDGKAASRPTPSGKPTADKAAEGKSGQGKASEGRSPAKPADGRTADGKPADTRTPKTAEAHHYVLQIGAFASEKGATVEADKVRAAGLKVYTEKIGTGQGARIRVRVGPFQTREQAEQARGQLKLVGIDSALIAP